ncbi:MAG: Reverse transcriptase [Deltaproteobacteria bacterium]|nr:Reverse transcriptase [Candidatus Desulfobacula maris]
MGGHSALSPTRHEFQARSSEWRSPPDLPSDSTRLESMLLTAIQKDGLSSDSLRKADKVSVRRAGFALKLRDIEAYSRALPPDTWKIQRHAFLNAFTRYILVLPTFFDFFNYLPRVLTLSISCADFDHFRQILEGLNKIIVQLKDCKNSIKEADSDVGKTSDQVLDGFEKNIRIMVQEAVESSFPLRLSKNSKKLWCDSFSKAQPIYEPQEISKIKAQHLNYLKKDLAHHPLKQYLIPPTISGSYRHAIAKKNLANFDTQKIGHLLQPCIIKGCSVVSRLGRLPVGEKLPSGLLFPTRPLGIHDLYLLHLDPFSSKGREEISACLLALRGFKPENSLPSKGDKQGSPIEVCLNREKGKVIRIAVTSWKTRDGSWVASVKRRQDPDHHRLNRLTRLLNTVISTHKRPDYLILPELSIPANWFLAIAGKLQTSGISLICGIEYLHGSKKKIHNQVWAALSHDALGFSQTMIYRQDKQHPAPHEAQELEQVNGKILKPQLKPWPFPPLICHGGFQFGMLVCSELTNIAYRTALRGKVDALFVPEWNQDTDTFNALVESAALDIHAYIIQCNHRQFGDSRIRAPYKDGWKRDIVRIKGGIEDYFVTGEIDIQALRAFQSNHRSPMKPFKPVPDGFEIAPQRKTLPTGNADE